MHKLLERQVRRVLGDRSRAPEDFLAAVDAAYAQADEDRRLLERAMELTSEELLERNEASSRSLSVLQATLEATVEGILVVDRHRRIETYNQRFVEIWEHPLDILERRDGRASVEHAATRVSDPEAFLASLDDLYDQPDLEWFDEIEMVDGRLIERFTRPIRHAEEILGRVWSFRDVTETRRLEDQIRQSQKMEAIGQLAGGIAHDFNNLLTVIRGSCELGCLRVDGSDAMIEKLFGDIAAAAHRASDLTSQLLSFSRRDVLAPEALAVDAAIRELESILQRLIRENIVLSTRLGSRAARILADRGRFHQVVLNLVINASDALVGGGRIEIETRLVDGPPPGLAPRAEASTEADAERHVLLIVRDDGEGIAPEIQSRIFEPFFTTKPVGKGTGLGLATVYGIVGQFGGTLELDSEVGRGTEFRLAFPLTDQRPRRVEGQVERPPVQHGTILAVEDDPPLRLLITEMLGLLDGFDVHVAATPAEALDRFVGADESIDLLISDIVMPEKTGFELAAALVEHHPEMRVLFVSGYDPNASSGWSITDEPYAAFLAKPFDWQTLEATIHEVLATAEAYRPGRRALAAEQVGG